MREIPAWLPYAVLAVAALAVLWWLAQKVLAALEKVVSFLVKASVVAVVAVAVLGFAVTLTHPPSVGTSGSPAVAAPAIAAPAAQKLLCPTPGFGISQYFGPVSWTVEGPYTFQGTYYPHFHTGIDLMATMGVEIHAAEDGVVSFSGKEAEYAQKGPGYGYGLMVEVKAGNRVTRYAHMSKILATEGQHVTRGQPLGLVGSTGASTAPHLHFGVSDNGGWVDPIPLMDPC